MKCWLGKPNGGCVAHTHHTLFIRWFPFHQKLNLRVCFWQLAYYFILTSPSTIFTTNTNLVWPAWTKLNLSFLKRTKSNANRELVFAIYYKIASIIALESRRKEISIKPLDVVDASCWFFFYHHHSSHSALERSDNILPLAYHYRIRKAHYVSTNYHSLLCYQTSKTTLITGKWNEPSCFIFTHFPVTITKFSTFFYSFFPLLHSTQSIAENVICTK